MEHCVHYAALRSRFAQAYAAPPTFVWSERGGARQAAKAGVVSGLSKEDRNIYGVYPMRGKLLNVRDETAKKIGDNKEITEIKYVY